MLLNSSQNHTRLKDRILEVVILDHLELVNLPKSIHHILIVKIVSDFLFDRFVMPVFKGLLNLSDMLPCLYLGTSYQGQHLILEGLELFIDFVQGSQNAIDLGLAGGLEDAVAFQNL